MKISSLRSSATMRQKSSSKFDKIADQIIRTVTIKGQQRFIDQDIPEDNISKEESEKRLIVYGLVTALLFSLSSLICIILIFQAFEAKNQIILSNVPMIEDSNFPIPHVAFMNTPLSSAISQREKMFQVVFQLETLSNISNNEICLISKCHDASFLRKSPK